MEVHLLTHYKESTERLPMDSFISRNSKDNRSRHNIRSDPSQSSKPIVMPTEPNKSSPRCDPGTLISTASTGTKTTTLQ